MIKLKQIIAVNFFGKSQYVLNVSFLQMESGLLPMLKGHEMGIFIKDVVSGSPAAGHRDAQSSDDKLNPGDRLVSVNGQTLMNCSQQDAVLIIKGARSPLRFVAQSCTIRSEENETLFSSVN